MIHSLRQKKRYINILSLLMTFALLFSYCVLFQVAVYAEAGPATPVDDLFSRAVLYDDMTIMTNSADPASNIGVALDSTIHLYFAHGVQVGTQSALKLDSINSNLIKLEQVSGTPGPDPVPVLLTMENAPGTGNQPIIITPDELLSNTQYKLTLQAGITANNNNYSASDIVIGFTTQDLTQQAGAPSLSGAEYNGTAVNLRGLPADAANLEYSIALDGSTFGDWADLTVNGTTASVAADGVLTGTSKIEVQFKAEGEMPASASASATIYAALGADIPLTEGVPVIYTGGVKIDPDQLQSGGASTVNVRNANSEVPSGPNDLQPKTGLAPAFYGVKVKGPNGAEASKVTVSLPSQIPDGYDVNKINVYRLDLTWAAALIMWMPMIETDKSDIDNQIIKIPLRNFDGQGIDEVLGVFQDPYYETNTVATQLISQTETSVTLRIYSLDYGIAKFKIYRNGHYLSDNTGPIAQEDLDQTFQTTFTDTPPGPGTYVYNATAVDYGGNEHLYGITSDYNEATVTIGGGASDAAGAIAAAKAGLLNGTISLGFAQGDSADSVTQCICLPSTPIPNTKIVWTSSRPDVINTSYPLESNVLKPADANEVEVVLTATITSSLDNWYLSDAVDIPVTVRWTPEAHVSTLEEFQRAIANPIVQTVLMDKLISSDDGIELDCQGKTLRPGNSGYVGFHDNYFNSYAMFAGKVSLKNAVLDAYGVNFVAPVRISLQHISSVVLDNVTFTGLENSQYAINVLSSSADSSNLTIKNCRFGPAKEGAIFIRGGKFGADDNEGLRYLGQVMPNFDITGNTFEGGGKSGCAIYNSCGITTIRDNTISGYKGSINGLPSAGIFVRLDVDGAISGNTITNCDNGIRVWTGETITTVAYDQGIQISSATSTGYTKVNGTSVQDAANAATAGSGLITANLITPAAGDGSRSVVLSNAADPNNPVLFYDNALATQLSPAVIADTTNNVVGQAIDLTFSQNSAWESAISYVKVDESILDVTKYTVGAGVIHLDGSVFTSAKDYAISIQAIGYAPALVTQKVLTTPLKNPPVMTTSTVLIQPQSGFSADPTVNVTFIDDSAWRNAITGVTVNAPSGYLSSIIDSCVFSATDGNLAVTLHRGHIYPTLMITVKAAGYADAHLIFDTYRACPVLTPDTSGNSVGQSVDITYNPYDYVGWSSNVTAVKVDGVALTTSQCVITWGNIHIDSSVFPVAKTYSIVITAGGTAGSSGFNYLNATVEQVIVEPGTPAPLTLKAQSTGNFVGQPVTLTFNDNQSWRNEISGIYLNGKLLDSSKYTVTSGQIRLTAATFASPGTYTVTVKATGYEDVAVTQFMAPAAVNLPPIVGNDNTDRMINKAIDLPFIDDPTWRSAITGITYFNANGSDQTTEFIVPADKYVVLPGDIHILPNVFPGSIYYHIKANGYSDAVRLQTLYVGEGVPLNPPALIADSSSNVLGQDIDVTFRDANWRNYISGVAVNNTPLTTGQYTVTAGKLRIAANAFTLPGIYTITVFASNLPSTYSGQYYLDATVSQTIVSPKYNLTVVPDSIYTEGIKNGISTMTVNSGFNGFGYFTVNTTPVAIYYKNPMVVFVQFRGANQVAIGAASVACDQSYNAVAGFSVKPGDLIKAYVVDGLTNDMTVNPVILQ